jgi:hypothetical protein
MAKALTLAIINLLLSLPTRDALLTAVIMSAGFTNPVMNGSNTMMILYQQ